jgi:HEAT repeat protein
MTSHTSPEIPLSGNSNSLASAIDAIAGGEFSRSRLATLSDLDRSRAAYLRERWQDIPEQQRHALLLALAELADQSLEFNFNRVFRIALDDPSPVIRQLAIADLWEDEGSDLPPTYVRLVQHDPSDDVRAAAADALSAACDAIADGQPSELDPEALIDLFSTLVEDPAESPIVRRRSLGTVASFGNDPRVEALIRLGLDDDDQTVVAGSIFAMGRTANDRWLPEIVEFMTSEDAELRFEAARAAGRIGDAGVVPELSELVYDPDEEVRLAAIEALGAIGGPAAVRVLRQIKQDEDFEELEMIDDAIDAALLSVDPLQRQS